MVRDRKSEIELFKNRFSYEKGTIFWKNGKRIGKEVGSIYKNGYKATMVGKIRYYVHTIIFAMHYNYFPNLIDHKDRNKLNNNISNLREATPALNTINTGDFANSTSGVKGVSLFKRTGKYTAQIKVNQKKIHLGYFKTIEDAQIARINAEKLYWT